jgi:excisionase family DNA binding protein
MEMTIQEAAAHLNVSVNTIRRRLFSGALTGTKVGTRWVLTIDGYGPDGKVREAEPDPVDQQSEIKWLREQLETRTREVAELHQLLGAHSLNPGRATSPWWAFWR